MLCTLVLNEMEWLPKLYEQHKHWPGLKRWIFVEAADKAYAETNPAAVTELGLSVDGTTYFLADLAEKDPRVIHHCYGFTSHYDPAQGKIPARNAYLHAADVFEPDYILILDADEFYSCSSQAIMEQMMQANSERLCHYFLQRHIWRPPSMYGFEPFANPHEVVGGYWKVPHARGWKWQKGMRYLHNHNTPCDAEGRRLRPNRWIYTDGPECIHLGYASSPSRREAKHTYYEARGEGKGDGREMYIACRNAWRNWRPGHLLPHRAKVIEYKGEIPEVFRGT